jgi:hypothetical protein
VKVALRLKRFENQLKQQEYQFNMSVGGKSFNANRLWSLLSGDGSLPGQKVVVNNKNTILGDNYLNHINEEFKMTDWSILDGVNGHLLQVIRLRNKIINIRGAKKYAIGIKQQLQHPLKMTKILNRTMKGRRKSGIAYLPKLDMMASFVYLCIRSIEHVSIS